LQKLITTKARRLLFHIKRIYNSHELVLLNLDVLKNLPIPYLELLFNIFKFTSNYEANKTWDLYLPPPLFNEVRKTLRFKLYVLKSEW